MEWVRIPQFTGYWVSDSGEVRREHKDKILTQRQSSAGMRVDIGGRTALVHNLVLRSFTGRPLTKGYRAKHRNGDKSDNRLENLMWTSGKGNK